MRWAWAAVLLAASAIVTTGCGGGSAAADGGSGRGGGTGGDRGTGGSAGSGGRAGAAGGGTGGNITGQAGHGGQGGAHVDGGASDLPVSTGTFPFPGRWWGSLSGVQLDGGTTVDKGPFVIHWSETDPHDRDLWTGNGVYALAANAEGDGSATLMMNAPGTSGCWSLYPTSDAHSLQVRSCDRPGAPGGQLGFFNDSPRLLAEVPVNPFPFLAVTSGTTGANNGGGQWAVFTVGSELWYWRADTGQVFDVGQSASTQTAASPDGRWLLFFGYGSDPGEQYPSLYALDTVTGTAAKIAESLVAAGTFGYSSVATFSPDSRRAAFYANATNLNRADLLAYEFATGQTTTLAPHAVADTPTDSTVAFLASGDRVVFAAYDATMSYSTGAIPTYAYDFKTGSTMSFGPANTLTPFPGRAYLALQTVTDEFAGTGQALLLHDETGFAPKVLTDVNGTTNFGTSAVFPDPTGAKVAYLAPGGVLDIQSVTGGSPLTLPGEAVVMSLVLEPPPVGDGAESRPLAAWFTTGGSIVHEVIDNNMTELRNYDPTSGSTAAFAVPDSSPFTVMSPLGDVVLTSGTTPTALVWPNPPVTLTAPGSETGQDFEAVYTFSASDRYLTYQLNGSLMVYDFSSAKTIQLAQLTIPARSVTSPATGVSVVWLDGTTPMKAYAPDGTAWTLPASGGAPLMNPSGSATAFSGTGVMSLRVGATPALVGNGAPLAITDTQVIFRDLDGVCAVALPAP